MSFNYKRNMILKILFPKVLIKFIRFIKHFFDQDHLIAILLTAGFKDVMARKFDSDIDLIDRKKQSIYAIVIK